MVDVTGSRTHPAALSARSALTFMEAGTTEGAA